MDNFQKDIDDRANLTLSNRFELLLFRLGTSLNENKSELFGINVFKLREICADAGVHQTRRDEVPADGDGEYPRSVIGDQSGRGGRL